MPTNNMEPWRHAHAFGRVDGDSERRTTVVVWMDPLMGIVGGLLIARWAWGLLRDTGHILLDSAVDPALFSTVTSLIESDSDNRIADLHIWRVGSSEHAAIVSVVSRNPRPPAHYKGLLSHLQQLIHVTVEVHKAAYGRNQNRPGEACETN